MDNQLDRLIDHDRDHEIATPGQAGSAGKSTLTSRLSPTPQIVFRVADPETARALGESLSGGSRGRIQRDADGGGSGRDANGVAAGAELAVDRAAGSSGAPLPTHLQRQFEGSLGADLSGVRVHTGGASAEAAHAVGAKAYTVGQDIHFGAGRYQPDDPFGMHLLAHEVAHTVQQAGGAQRRQHKLEVSAPQDAAEHEADRAADAMVRNQHYQIGGIELARVNRSLDSKMTDYEGSFSTGMTSSAKRINIIGGHSTIGDATEAENIIAKIDKQTDGLTKAAGEIGNGGSFDDCVAENVTTRFRLQEYVSAVKQSGGALDGFKPAYEAARRDYGALIGLSAAFTEGKTDTSNLPGGSELAKVAGATQQLDANSSGMAAKVDAMKGGNPSTFGADLAALKTARDQLETARAGILQQDGKVKSSGNRMKAAVSKAQAAAASAKGDKKKKELESLKATISAVAGAVGTAIEMGGKVFKAAQAPDVTAKTQTFVDEYVQVQDRQFAVQSHETTVTAGPSRAAKFAELGKDLASGNATKAVEAVLTQVLSPKIQQMSSAIAAAKEEQNLNEAVAAQAELEAAKQEYSVALSAASNLLNGFEVQKQRVTSLVDKLAKFSARTGNPNMAAAFRFMGAADKFLAQCDVAIQMGDNQAEAGKEALKIRDRVNSPISNGDKSLHGKAYWWQAFSKDEFSTRALLDGERKMKEWVAQKNELELKNAGDGSLIDGHGSNGAQFDVAGAVGELRKQKTTIAALRDKAQSSLGVGAASPNMAITPAAG
ncbi:MAG: DUF4157 domain-containing protein [Kofleriaceae bacterium]